MFAMPEGIALYATNETSYRDGWHLVFKKDNYVMAANQGFTGLQHTLKSNADSAHYTFTLEYAGTTTKIDNTNYYNYHVFIEDTSGNKHYLTGNAGLTQYSNYAGLFLIYRANITSKGSGTRLCLFSISSSNAWKGAAVEYESNGGWGSIKLCAENDKDYNYWNVCNDAYDLEEEQVLVEPQKYTVIINKVYSGSDNSEASNLQITLKDKTNKTYSRKESSGNTYTFEDLLEGTYTVEESGYTINGYDFVSAKLEATKSNENITLNFTSPSATTSTQSIIGGIIGGIVEWITGGDDSSTQASSNTKSPIVVNYTLTNTYEKHEAPKASKAEKEVIYNECPAGITLTLPIGVTVTYPAKNNDVVTPILIDENTQSVTLLYKITVTGQPTAAFEVTDASTTLAYAASNTVTQNETTGVYSGNLPAATNGETSVTLDFYVIRTFDSFPDNSGELTNNVSLTGGDGDEEKVPYEKKALVTITKQFVGLDDGITKPTLTIELENTVEGTTPEKVTLSETSNGTYVYSGRVPAGTYKVKETLGTVQYYTLDSTELKNGNDTVRDLTFEVKNGETHSYTLVNTYSKNNPDNATFNPGNYIVKNLTGATLPNAQTFSVKAKIKNTDSEKTGTTTSKTSFSNEPFVFADTDKFSISSETTFEVKEAQGTAVNGLTYNDKTYELKVTVKVDTTTNAYVVDKVSWREGDAGDFKVLGTNEKLVITNTYTAPRTTAVVTLTKVYSGTGSTVGTVSQIKLKNKTTNVEYTFNRQGDGKFTCESELPAGDYTVVEDANAAKINGYTWLGVTPTVTVTEDHIKTGNVSFELTNTYKENEKTPAKVNFSDLIRKELTIKGDYSFTGETFEAKLTYIPKAKPYSLIDTDSTSSYVLKAVFDKYADSGDVKKFVKTNGDDLVIEFPAADDYYFVLSEEIGNQSGVTYDESVYYIKVEVALENDVLKVTNILFDKYLGSTHKEFAYVVKEGVLTDTKLYFYNTVNTGYKSNDHIKIDSPNKLNTDDHYAYIIGYPDGTVQPNGEITRAEVATIFFRLLKDDVREKYFTKTNDFSDVSRSDWFNNPVSTMAELGIVKGYPDGTFRPNEPITRAEFAAIAARFDESSRYGETRFTDVAGHWAIREIAKAYNNGWIKGYPDNTFRPNRNITRAEAMTLINRVLNRAPETEKDLLNNMNKWSDNMDVDAWYYLAVQEATNSHDYRRKSSSYEHWIRMLEDPNWAKYER